jgi:hypothetical protein
MGINLMRLWSAAGFGKFLCVMGLVVAAWGILERATEEVFLASVSQCVVRRTADTVLVAYMEGEMRISCSVAYERQGREHVATLEAGLPQDFDPQKESRRAEVSISRFSPKVARFKNFPGDWETPLARTMMLEFVGFLLIVMTRRTQLA